MKLEKKFDDIKNEWIFTPIGDIDIHNADEFKLEVLNSFNKKNNNLVIDGKKLDYIDSMGLGALIYILKEVKDTEYKIILENIKPNIQKLLDITELDKMFVIRGEDNE